MKALLKLIYARAGMEIPDFNSIAVERSQRHIDSLCVVNKELVIVIDEKVGWKGHTLTIDQYRVHVTTELGYTPENIILVYIQTGGQDDYENIIKSGYMLIRRADLLEIFESEEAEAAKDAVQSYCTTPPSQQWPWEAWKGFYSKLQEKTVDGHWGYRPYQAGGFLGYWWHFRGDEAFKAFLQQ